MKSRPILFSGPMVRALLEGRKTQTRRAQGLDDANINPAAWEHTVMGPLNYMTKKSAKGKYGATFRSYSGAIEENTLSVCPQICPYGQPGDLLWVRETFLAGLEFDDNGMPTEKERVWYRATEPNLAWYDGESDFPREIAPWKPSIHMPRKASRLTLRITDVRVERLQDISQQDAIAEGIKFDGRLEGYTVEGGNFFHCLDPRISFCGLWESISGPESWEANPWVWVVSFEVIRANVDQVLQEKT